MLQQLEINNIALIDRISVELGQGLNILTGETGAGKSIIIDSINAILGERVSKDLIRTGKDKASVEAIFHMKTQKLADFLENLGIDPEEDGTLVVSREFNHAGRNVCRINGKIATVSMLKELGELLIDIHGQHDNQSLLRTESHIELLDSFGGGQIQLLKQQYSALLEEYKGIKARLKHLTGDVNERERKIDLLKFQLSEIKKAKLKPGEDEGLNKQRLLLANSEKITAALSVTYEKLFSGNSMGSSAADTIQEAVNELGGIVRLDPKYGEIVKKLEEITYQLEDIIDTVRKEKDEIEYNPALLEQIDERIDLIFRLKRKYGNTIEDILNYAVKTERELEEIVGSEEIIQDLNKQIKSVGEELYKLAVLIHEERKKSAQLLESKISEELSDLEMKKAQFKVSIDFDESLDVNGERKYFHTGLDKVEFLISANAGEPLKSLSKIASGGEMSRIMLAIKKILADVDRVSTLIFDEIDIGISGRAAQKVGEKLSYISKNHQVICVTHLAQIACMADHHYRIEKQMEEDTTRTHLDKLDGSEVNKEIARILGGSNISDITVKHAEEILENARKFKTTIVS